MASWANPQTLLDLGIKIPDGAVSFTAGMDGINFFVHDWPEAEPCYQGNWHIHAVPTSEAQKHALHALGMTGTWGVELNVFGLRGYRAPA